ncbi:hypothetical protein [Streptomyces sp. AK04-3B]|uniref:hypothetical protein n=1 Tax=Streptomyces sp. AK04-3B TaxID=3028650 RepID=UPI0029BA6481|nr:hypothetical protein [Streptomyces sp. AK04-3B]MDX3801086.1 hypothetical protein [Streptomyces sp. AK04-3B]
MPRLSGIATATTAGGSTGLLVSFVTGNVEPIYVWPSVTIIALGMAYDLARRALDQHKRPCPTSPGPDPYEPRPGEVILHDDLTRHGPEKSCPGQAPDLDEVIADRAQPQACVGCSAETAAEEEGSEEERRDHAEHVDEGHEGAVAPATRWHRVRVPSQAPSPT